MILSINSSTLQFSAALMQENGAVLAEYFMSPGSKHFTGFMPTVHYLLTTSKFNMQDIRALVVALGPGSFTGLRVGLSVAKGLCQGLQIPIIGVSSLEAMANQLPYSIHPVCPMIDCRKGEIFTALFSWCDDGKMVRIKEDACLKFEDLSSFIEETTLFLGNDFNGQSPFIMKTLARKALLAPPRLWNLTASAVGAIGLERFHEQDFAELEGLVPNYLRPPDIRPNPFAPRSEEPAKQVLS